MRNAKAIVILMLALGAAAASAPALADHWHGHSRVHLGLYFGAPGYWEPYYYPPYPYYYPPYYPPTVVVPQSPPVYIEKGGQAQQEPAGQGWWYFCRESNAYYPYVKHCPGGWEKVAPQPPAQ